MSKLSFDFLNAFRLVVFKTKGGPVFISDISKYCIQLLYLFKLKNN
jgi:hypothetical protein